MPTTSKSVWIVSPSNSGALKTDGTSVSLSGGSFVPEGASCTGIVGIMPPGYQVVWSNAANARSVHASFHLGCLLQVNVIGDASETSLETGSSPITVAASDSVGNMAADMIVRRP